MKSFFRKNPLRQIFFTLLLILNVIVIGEMSCKGILNDKAYPYFLGKEYFGEDSLTHLNEELQKKNVTMVVEYIQYHDNAITIQLFGKTGVLEDFVRKNSYQRVKSVFFSDISVEYNDLDILPRETLEQSVVYLVSEKNVMELLTADWIMAHCEDLYPARKDGHKNISFTIRFLLGILFLFAGMMTYFEVQENNKELVLRMIIGETKTKLLFLSLLHEITVTGIILASVLLLLQHFTTIIMPLLYLKFFVLYVLLLLCIYGITARLYYKQMWAGNDGSIINIVMCAVFFICSLTVTFVMIMHNVDGLKQYNKEKMERRFFEAFEEYYEVAVKKTDYSDELYIEALSEKDAVLFMDYARIDLGQEELEVVLYNRNSFEWLNGCHDRALTELSDETPFVYYIPECFKEAIEEEKLPGFIFGEAKADTRVCYYGQDLIVPATNGSDFMGEVFWFDKPVIMVDNRVNLSLYKSNLLPGFGVYFRLSFLVKNIDKYRMIKGEENLVFKNVWELYKLKHHDTIMKMRWGLLVIMILLIVEIVVLMIILKQYFYVEKKVLLIKKVFGWNFFKRHRNFIVFETGGVGIAILLASYIVGETGKEALPYELILAGIILAGSFIYIARAEAGNIAECVKGNV